MGNVLSKYGVEIEALQHSLRRGAESVKVSLPVDKVKLLIGPTGEADIKRELRRTRELGWAWHCDQHGIPKRLRLTRSACCIPQPRPRLYERWPPCPPPPRLSDVSIHASCRLLFFFGDRECFWDKHLMKSSQFIGVDSVAPTAFATAWKPPDTE